MKTHCSKKCTARKVEHLADELYHQIEVRLKLQSRDNRVSCAAARTIADELGVPPHEVGNVANHLDIRINQCQLGCF